MVRPLRSTPTTGASSLLRTGPPARPASVLNPSQFLLLGALPLTTPDAAGGGIGTCLPTFHATAADQARVAFMPDTTRPVNEHPPDSSRDKAYAPVSMSHMEFRHFISDSLTFAFLIPTWRLAGAFSSSLTTHGIQPAQHEAVWSLPPQGDSEGPNLHQLHSTAITWTYLRSPGSSVRGTPTCPTILGDSARSALVSVQPVKTIETVRVWAYSPRKSSPSWPPTSVSCPPRLLIPVGPRTDRDLRFSRLSGLAARKAPQLQTLTFPGEPAVDGGQRHHIQLCRDRVAEVMRKDRSRTTTGVVTMPPGELTQLVHARGLIRSRRRPVPGGVASG